jgi:hypothetical protein
MSLDRPILVTGTPRSGKTLVSAILAKAPGLLSLEEPLMVWDAGARSRADDRRVAADATPEVCRSIVQRCEQLMQEAGKQRYMDNLAYHALRIPFVLAVMPEARIVHVVRDAREAIPELLYGWTLRDSVGKAFLRRRNSVTLRSLPRHAARFARNYVLSRVRGRRATWGPRVPGLAEFVRTHSPAEVAAFQWVEMVRIAMDDLQTVPRDRWIEVRYEQLMADPAGQAARVAAFAQVEGAQYVIDHAQQFFKPGFKLDRRVDPTAEEWDKIEPLIRPLQQRLGYA